MKLTLFAAAMVLLLLGCAHREGEYAPAYGYGGGMLAYGDCVYPDPCGGYWPYDSEGFYPAPGSGFERHPVQLSQRRPPTHKVTAAHRISVRASKPPVMAIHAAAGEIPNAKPRKRCDQAVKRLVKE